jgi:signal transduction histidine kinase
MSNSPYFPQEVPPDDIERFSTERRSTDLHPTDAIDTLLHQLRNPLTALGTFTKLLQKRIPPDDANQWLVEHIDRECQHLQSLLVQFEQQRYSPADGSAPVKQSCQLSSFLNSLWPTYRALAAERGIQLQSDWRFPSDLPPLVADPLALREALDNLMDNALKYTPSGGTAILMAKVDVAEATNGGIEIQIRDNGPGIAAADLPHIFDPYFRGNGIRSGEKLLGDEGDRVREGRGLGLAIARDLVQRMGGELEVCSQLGKGTTFTIHLPKQGVEHERTHTVGG